MNNSSIVGRASGYDVARFRPYVCQTLTGTTNCTLLFSHSRMHSIVSGLADGCFVNYSRDTHNLHTKGVPDSFNTSANHAIAVRIWEIDEVVSVVKNLDGVHTSYC